VRQLALAVGAVGWLGASQQIAGRLVHNLQISLFVDAGKLRLSSLAATRGISQPRIFPKISCAFFNLEG
jgi:hypothetical protein